MTYDPRQLEILQRFLAELPRGAKSVVVPAITEYLMGGESGAGGESFHGLKHYPAFRAWPGGQQFPQRTGRLQRGWRVTGEPYRQKIVNNVPYAGWIHGDSTQTWRAEYGGWRTVTTIIASNINGAMRSAISALNKWIKSKLK
jgi:hypothetical protein